MDENVKESTAELLLLKQKETEQCKDLIQINCEIKKLQVMKRDLLEKLHYSTLHCNLSKNDSIPVTVISKKEEAMKQLSWVRKLITDAER